MSAALCPAAAAAAGTTAASMIMQCTYPEMGMLLTVVERLCPTQLVNNSGWWCDIHVVLKDGQAAGCDIQVPCMLAAEATALCIHVMQFAPLIAGDNTHYSCVMMAQCARQHDIMPAVQCNDVIQVRCMLLDQL